MRILVQLTQVLLLMLLSTLGLCAVYYTLWTAAAFPMEWWMYIMIPLLATLTDFGLFSWIRKT